MNKPATRWPPQVGYHAQIVSTGASVVVIEGKDSHRFLVALYSHELGTVTTAPFRSFTLRELSPESSPPTAHGSRPAARRRRAGPLPAAG